MEKLLEILKGIRPDIDFDHEDNLIEDGFLTSFDIVAILAQINDEFDVEIDMTEIDPDDFGSAEAIWNLIQKKQNA